ncbi:peptidoglycan-binding domain-containing protein, partial [Halobacillus trueperi]|uniref:peptidoglycan-binding domain-containing protein n=1 Tax=Halobacillus trueperi TaxID=156205 RepID=UPI0021632500
KGWVERGDKGDSVKELQSNLHKLGYSLAIDGSFGPETEKALKGFQSAHHLTVDGLYGPNTQKALEEALKRYASVAHKEEENQVDENLKETGFADVEPDKYYSKAVKWGKDNKLMLGYGEDNYETFGKG